MVSVNKNNPVGRLLSIIEEVLAFRENIPFNESYTKEAAWRIILDLEESDGMELIRSMLEISDLARKSRLLISAFSPNPELFLDKFEYVELVVLPNELDKDFSRTSTNISSETVTRLKFASDMLAQHYNEGEVEDSELQSISTLVTSLFSEIKSSNVDFLVKSFLLESLEGIRRAIAHYEIYGAKGLRDAFQSAIGGVVANKDSLEKLDKGTLDKFASILAVLDKSTATAFKAKEVLGKTFKLLGIDSE